MVIVILYFGLSKVDRNLINVITIIGTVLTIGALTFTIREQSILKRTSDAIKENTDVFKNKLINRSFEVHVNKCLKFISSIQENITDEPLLRVHLRLVDLKECLIECKKIVLLKEINDAHVARMQDFENYTKIITGYCTQIQVANYRNDSIVNRNEFIANINEIQNFLNEVRDNQIFDVI